ncbi:MAG: NADH-quinone oxidoreductase subunit NuoK [Bacteroidota bacterium]
MLSLEAFLVLSILLFSLGIFLILSRRNAIMALMGVELILNAANVNFVAFAQYDKIDLDGQMAALFVMALAAAEVAVALAIILQAYRSFGNIDLGKLDKLNG